MEKFDINEFYQWARQTYCVDGGATHPLNWITLANHSSMFDSIDKSVLTGLPHLIKGMSERLVGKRYKYVPSPDAYTILDKNAKIKDWDNKNMHPIYKGKLSFSNGDFYLSGFEKRKIPIKKAWILEEIK
jgi:hypothetical protein